MPESVQILRTKADTATPDTIPTDAAGLPEEAAIMPLGCSKAAVLLQLVDSDGDQLVGAATTVDVTVVVWAEGVRVDDETTTTIVTSVETLTGWVASEPIIADVPTGLRFWVGLSALTDPPGSIDACRVAWYPYKA